MTGKGHDDQAINNFIKALEIDSISADVYYNRGITRFDEDNIQQVPADFEERRR